MYLSNSWKFEFLDNWLCFSRTFRSPLVPKNLTVKYDLLYRRANLKMEKGESQNGGNKKTKHDKFSEKRTYVCVSGGKKCWFFRKFAILVFLSPPFWDSLFCLVTDAYGHCSYITPSKSNRKLIFIKCELWLTIELTINSCFFISECITAAAKFNKYMKRYQSCLRGIKLLQVFFRNSFASSMIESNLFQKFSFQINLSF